MLHKVKKFTKLSSEEKKLFLEVYLTLGIIHIAILIVSFKHLTRSLEHLPNKEEITVLHDNDTSIATAFGKSITRAIFYIPWESACLELLTVQCMLQKREILGVFYMGIIKDEEAKKKMKAHVWMQCGETITDGVGHEDFTILSMFGWGKE